MDSTRPIRALMRGLDALTVLNMTDGATVSEVAAEIGLPRTTTHRILATLCESGFVVREAADERYRLTILVRNLSYRFEDEAWVTKVAKPLLLALGTEIVWPISLATLSGTCMLVREATDHGTPLANEHYAAGSRLPLTSAGGRAYLAHCAAAEREALVDALSGADRSLLLGVAAEVKRQGYAIVTHQRRSLTEINLSMPVLHGAHPLATLTVRFMASVVPMKTGLERFLPKLRRCAADISHAYVKHQAATRVSAASPVLV